MIQLSCIHSFAFINCVLKTRHAAAGPILPTARAGPGRVGPDGDGIRRWFRSISFPAVAAAAAAYPPVPLSTTSTATAVLYIHSRLMQLDGHGDGGDGGSDGGGHCVSCVSRASVRPS